jgi:hypothetical protein
MLPTESDAVVWVIEAPLFRVGITTLSLYLGTLAVLQLLAVSQFPPLGLIQVTVAGWIRGSRASTESESRVRHPDRARALVLVSEKNLDVDRRRQRSSEKLIVVHPSRNSVLALDVRAGPSA